MNDQCSKFSGPVIALIPLVIDLKLIVMQNWCNLASLSAQWTAMAFRIRARTLDLRVERLCCPLALSALKLTRYVMCIP